MLLEKNTILQIFGSLMKKPTLLTEVDRYTFYPSDFSSSFEKYIYGAIYNLFSAGVEKINIVDVDNYLKEHSGIYETFKSNRGIEYLQDALDIAQEDNFGFYYNKLKKYNAIKDLNSIGLKTDWIYPEDEFDKEYNKKIQKFEETSVLDIFNLVRTKLSEVESKYGSATVESIYANYQLEELLKRLKESPDVGPCLQGNIFNTIVRGARQGMYYIRSAGTGIGKTRSIIGDACHLAYPIRYNPTKKEWEKNGSSNKVLYVATEQKPVEIQTMILAYITGINEEKFLLGTYTEEEYEVVKIALQVMKKYEGNLIIARLPDPCMAQIKLIFRQYCLQKDVKFVFYDYIFSSPALLNEYRDLGIREDVILGHLSTLLKDMAAELGIFVMSSTQITGDLTQAKGIRNQSFLRGSKAIADKADGGIIAAVTTRDEQELLASVVSKVGKMPNQVADIYKIRGGRFKDVRVWSYMDLGTCRKEDLLVTDDQYNPVEEFSVIEFLFEEPDYSEEVNKYNHQKPNEKKGVPKWTGDF